jgi:hypothetical protein
MLSGDERWSPAQASLSVARRDDDSVWRSWLGFLFDSTGPIIFVLKLLFLVVVAILDSGRNRRLSS